MTIRNIGSVMASAATVAILLLCVVFVSADTNEGAPSGPITFDLNGGTLNGNGSFVMTAEELSSGLPDITGAINGTKEFMVWSTEKLNYSHLYNVGDEAPSGFSTLYALWGVNVNTSNNVTINTGGCYIVKNLSNKSLNIGGSGDVLIVLDNVNQASFQVTKNTTFIVRGENSGNTFNGWNVYNLEFSSASTGHISFNGNLNINGPMIINADVTVGGTIRGSKLDLDGNVVAGSIETPGNLTIRGTVTANTKIQGSIIDIDGTVTVLTGGIEASNKLTIRGTVTAHTQIKGSSVDIDGIVTAGSIYTGGNLKINGTVTVDTQLQGSSIQIEGTTTVLSGNVFTNGALTIDGNVTVSGGIQGNTIDITGTVVSNTIWPTPTISDSAVIIIGGVDNVQPGKEYLILSTEPGFDTSGVTDINVQFEIVNGAQTSQSSSNLLNFNNKVFLATGVKILQQGNGDHIINIYYSYMGKEYHSVGNAIYVPGSPGYYTCVIGEGTEVGGTVEEPLKIISYPTTIDSENAIYVHILHGSMSVRLVRAGTEMTISDPDENGIIFVNIPELSTIYGFWGTWDSFDLPDAGSTNEYTIIDQDDESSGICVLFVSNHISDIDSEYYVTTPICFVITPELEIVSEIN